MPFVSDLRLDVLSTLTPEAIERIRPFRDYVLIRRTPTRTMSAGGLHIPSIAQDESMEGIVVAVGPGRVFPPRFCGFPTGPSEPVVQHPGLRGYDLSDTCGETATHRSAHRDDAGDIIRVRYMCPKHAEFAEQLGDEPTRLLERRPVGVEKGQRVVFSKHAGGRQFKRVRGPDGKMVEYILTDDVIGACEPGCGMVERSERYA
jgi:co-chaperonin GroES (HSP10)